MPQLPTIDLSGFGHQVGYQLVVKVNILDVFLLGACFTDCTMVNHHLNPSKQANPRNRLPAGCPKVVLMEEILLTS